MSNTKINTNRGILHEYAVNLAGSSTKQLEELSTYLQTKDEVFPKLEGTDITSTPSYLVYSPRLLCWKVVKTLPPTTLPTLGIRQFIARTEGGVSEPLEPASEPLEPAPKPPKVVEEKPKIIWKSPKKVPNARKVVAGQDVLIHGLETGQCVESINGDNIAIVNVKKVYKLSEVYPLVRRQDELPQVGDIVVIHHAKSDSLVHDIVTKLDGNSFVTTTGTYSNSELRTIYSPKPIDKVYNKYTCGGIVFEDKRYKTLKALKAENQNYRFSVRNVAVSLEIDNIAKHYNMDKDFLTPKDVAISKQVKVSLDHPLNVKAKEWVLLVGESGSGKTEAAIRYAKDKKCKYIKMQGSAQVTVDDLQGYKSITTGEYFPSLLRTAVEEGNIFILDECDSMNPNTLLSLNGLKQEYYQFPDKLVKVHKDFRLLATANTLEYNEVYNARSPMDKATLARFDVIRYDLEPYELALRYGLSYVKRVTDIGRLTPREVEREIIKFRIKEEDA